jgi:hypothetical protein
MIYWCLGIKEKGGKETRYIPITTNALVVHPYYDPLDWQWM